MKMIIEKMMKIDETPFKKLADYFENFKNSRKNENFPKRFIERNTNFGMMFEGSCFFAFF